MIKFSMLLAPNNRSKSYLQNFLRKNFIPESVIVLNTDKNSLPENRDKIANQLPKNQKLIRRIPFFEEYYDENEELETTLQNAGIEYKSLNTLNVNSTEVIKAVSEVPADYIIYSGPGGTLLGREILNTQKQFIHAHPGKLPYYKGSTTIYYSYLIDGKAYCSVILLNEKIDSGPLLFEKEIEININNLDFDHSLDPLLRTSTLIDFLKTDNSVISTNDEAGNNFYIIHPVLKHLAILKNRV